LFGVANRDKRDEGKAKIRYEKRKHFVTVYSVVVDVGGIKDNVTYIQTKRG